MSALKRSPPVATFAPGIVYLQRKSGADIVPVAMWMSERTVGLYDRARRGAGTR
jgi:1-acyl-sn-glycerol-3-phosphate acyltransferase